MWDESVPESVPATVETMTRYGAYVSAADTLLMWHGHGYDVAGDVPSGGDTAGWGVLDIGTYDSGPDHADCPVYLSIRYASWGEYDGRSSTVERSNARVLTDEYGEYIVTVRGSIGDGETLLIPLSGQEVPGSLVETVAGLHEHPVISEDEMNELEFELESEDWESWGRSDFRRAIDSAARAADDEDFDSDEEWSDDEITDIFRNLMSNDVIGDWQTETATGGYWPHMNEGAKAAYEAYRAGKRAEVEAYARGLNPTQPETLI